MSRDWESDDRQVVSERAKVYCRHLPAEAQDLWFDMERYMADRLLSMELARNNYWYPSRAAGDSAPRIVIPASSAIPGNMYWQARSMDDTPPKYQSPRAARGDAVIRTWPAPGGRRSPIVIVEGPMDALAASGAGYPGIALMGERPSEAALALTSALIRGTISILVADQDAVGTATAIMGYLLSAGCTISLTSPPAGRKDLAAMAPSERKEFLSNG